MKSPPLVLFVTASLGGGGAERVFSTVLAHLDRSRIRPELALIRRRGAYLGQVPADIPIHELGGKRLPGAIWPLYKLLWTLRPDVVIATLTHVNIITGLLTRLVPYRPRLVLRETNLPSLNVQRLDAPKLMAALYGLAYNRADSVLCQGAYMAADVATWGVSRQRLRTAENPLDIAEVTRLAAGENPYSSDRFHLVACSRLSWEKGVDLLLDAFAIACENNDALHLTLVGSGPEEAALKVQATRLGIAGRVDFIGFIDNPYPYLRHADVMVLPSRFEPFSNAVAEALALGTPVLAFDCPGDTTRLIDEGINGWIVPPEQTGPLADKMVQVAGQPSLDAATIAATVTDLDVAKTVQAYTRVILAER